MLKNERAFSQLTSLQIALLRGSGHDRGLCRAPTCMNLTISVQIEAFRVPRQPAFGKARTSPKSFL